VPALKAPELTDGTVTLRPHRPEDAEPIAAACRDPEIQRWLPRIPRDYTVRDFEAWRAESARMAAEGRSMSLLIIADDEPIGAIGLNDFDTKPHIGYWIAAPARGRGLAVRALRLMRDWVYRELGVAPVEVLIHPDNVPSRRVALRAGFTPTGEYRTPREGDVPGRDYLVYAWPDDAGAGAGAG
jgi:RimJ/RimL family protein N-acetyltransferase